jgi:hypothetical protein
MGGGDHEDLSGSLPVRLDVFSWIGVAVCRLFGIVPAGFI